MHHLGIGESTTFSIVSESVVRLADLSALRLTHPVNSTDTDNAPATADCPDVVATVVLRL